MTTTIGTMTSGKTSCTVENVSWMSLSAIAHARLQRI